MTTDQAPIRTTRTLAELAASEAGAWRVFHRHDLDFCCHGDVALEIACSEKGLDVDQLVAELDEARRQTGEFVRLDEKSSGEIMDHLLAAFHEPHRAELPRLIEMASKVEEVHAEKASCPRGLTSHLLKMLEELEEHMQKEEQVLFPLFRAGRGAMAQVPVSVMREEHREHGKNLEELRRLATGYAPPEEACGTWRALYSGLAELERDLMEHIHIENNILFPKAMRE